MRLRQQLAQIFVTSAVLDEHGKSCAIFHQQFATDDWAHVLLARRNGKTLRAINPIAIEQRHRRHLELGRGFS